VTNATFVGGLPRGNFTVDNSLFVDVGCGDQPLGGANNLQWPDGNACAGGTTFADPQLGVLGENGGPTPTAMPAANGAVEDVGVDCPSTDQRGEPRDANSCAAGSVEP
jgi:hypothetical protein